MIRFTFKDLLAATGAMPRDAGAHDELRLVGVTTDTREVRPGQLFVAIEGPNFDGDRYAADAFGRGAGAVLVRREETARELPSDLAVAVAPDTVRALGDLAAWHRSRLTCPVLAITGSVAKTSTKNAAAALLSGVGHIAAAPKSFNNSIGVPHTLLLADDTTRAVVLEVGTSAPGEIAALTRIAKPVVGVITAIGHSHLEGLGGIEGVCEEKGQLGAELGPDDHLVLDSEGDFVDRLRSMTRANVRTFSVEGRGDWNARAVRDEVDHLRFEVTRPDGAPLQVAVPLIGAHNAANIAAALAAVDAMGFRVDELVSGLTELRAAPHRMQRIHIGGVELIDDTYNSNPDSARNAVRVLAGRKTASRRVMVLGDMLELGALAADHHRELGGLVAAARFELLVCVGDLGEIIAEGALAGGMPSDRVVHHATTEEAVAAVPARLRQDDVVLFKASRGLALERVVDAAATVLERGAHRAV
ncbi:UDP-N-acetylmuramoyl-tripeptide--D-alanyl-D-alanine ligase MurF [Planctomycetes bacterium Pla163]|uniref:UDP-N-acetylmuramoyl-tripeptide--D-alanyl-D-alanine ligase n=1 Tax=Rohdeia mirabilis TaxID=2528008 RepID=A0A518CYK2_9BACT|nr:UDP-N-acetylmuramoyl-tripeptide--D-alanyl-D-alanine ligase MurF [Planctomycetes bacterium Pla163]